MQENKELPDFQHVLADLTKLSATFIEQYISMLNGNMDLETNKAFAELTKEVWSNPEKWMEFQQKFYQKQLSLWMNFWTNSMGMLQEKEGIKDRTNDKRFENKEWNENPVFNFIKQSYLLVSNQLLDLSKGYDLSDEYQKRINFHTRQFVNALSPTNFAITNPEVLQTAVETNGQSLVNGLTNLLGDLEKGRTTMTDESQFKIGENIAVTEGAVVFENALFQLIQYKPLTETVHEMPLLIFPPWINKFYILDLSPSNSYAKWIVEQGYTVFMVSWKSADESIEHYSWEDYIEKGSLAAIEAVKEICGVKKINALGFCIGGTLLSCTLAILQARKNKSINSATFLATMIDFTDTGEISVFVDEDHISKNEEKFKDGGVLSGNQLANTFASLRENDLVWSYVVNNYLKGKTPPPFDLLYWNGDPTNLPGCMYAYYMRNMYLENNLIKKNVLTLCGNKIDISSITVPTFFLATQEDHIAPWKTCFNGFKVIGGEKVFCLGGSGHIAGIVNHPGKKKRNHWINEATNVSAEAWQKGAETREGSWWTPWIEWLNGKNTKNVPPRIELGSEKNPIIEKAPGRYVMEMIGED